VRIPAALCGIVGFKPSRQRIPTEGAFPLSFTLDSIGPLGRSVADCAKADAVMAGEDLAPLEPVPLAGLRFALAEGLPLEGLDDTVAAAFAAALNALDGAGVRITRDKLSMFDDMAEVNAKGGIVPPEACAIHRDRLKRRAADVDPNVRVRIERGCAVPAADYIETVRARRRLVRALDRRLAGTDALAMPTTAIVAPTIAEVADPKVFAARNFMLLRNTAIGNFFDLCAISLPLPAVLPVGFMLLARNGQDRMLLRIAAAVEKLFG
jgi:aspartyl-tRNA(Asn)/glutamyl-tRNA(Gln) amidotransferase subunit A